MAEGEFDTKVCLISLLLYVDHTGGFIPGNSEHLFCLREHTPSIPLSPNLVLVVSGHHYSICLESPLCCLSGSFLTFPTLSIDTNVPPRVQTVHVWVRGSVCYSVPLHLKCVGFLKL